MNYQIPCEQFIFGKFTGVLGARYDLIAKSSGITQEEAWRIHKEFRGCRPPATSLSSFKGAYVTTKLEGGKLVLLHIAIGKELGRGFFLHEHYIVLDSEYVVNQHTEFWFLLTDIPEPRPFYEFEELPNYFLLNRDKVDFQINQSIEKLLSSKDSYFQKVLINALFHLLYSRSVVVKLNDDFANFWIWLAAISVLVPTRHKVNFKLFIGRDLPDWKADIIFIEQGRPSSDSTIVDVSFPDKLLSLDQLKQGYANFSWRCIESEDSALFSELVDAVETYEFDRLDNDAATPLDYLLWLSAITKVGIKLAKRDIDKNAWSISDLRWLWQHQSQCFLSEDLERFLPILVRDSVTTWEQPDYEALRDVIERTSPAFMKKIINVFEGQEIEYKVPILLDKWIDNTKAFSKLETIWFVHLSRKLLVKYPDEALSLLIKWLNTVDQEDLFSNNIIDFAHDVPMNFVDNTKVWSLYCSLTYKIKIPSDIKNLIEFFVAIPYSNGISALVDYLITFIGKDSQYSDEKIRANLLEATSYAKETGRLNDVMLSFFHFSILQKHVQSFIVLTTLVHQWGMHFNSSTLPENSKDLIDSDWNNATKEWVLSSSNIELISSYLFVITRFGFNNLTEVLLVEILLSNLDVFHKVINLILKNFKVDRCDVAISIDFLASSCSQKQQLLFLGEYLLATSSISPDQKYIDKFNQLLLEVPSLDGLNSKRQAQLLNYFINLGFWETPGRILEHQTRLAILQGKISTAIEKIGDLQKIIGITRNRAIEELTSFLRADVATSYIRSLPVESKSIFYKQFLEQPLGSYPIIERRFNSLMSGYLLEINPTWIVDDPIVRLHIYVEIIKTITPSNK